MKLLILLRIYQFHSVTCEWRCRLELSEYPKRYLTMKFHNGSHHTLYRDRLIYLQRDIWISLYRGVIFRYFDRSSCGVALYCWVSKVLDISNLCSKFRNKVIVTYLYTQQYKNI